MDRLGNDVPKWLVLGLLTAAIAGILLVLLSPGLPADRGSNSNAVASAVERTAALPGARMRYTARARAGAGRVRLDGGGAFNNATGRGYFAGAFEFGDLGALQSSNFLMVVDGLDSYTRWPEISSDFGTELPWVFVDGAAMVEEAERLGVPAYDGSINQLFQGDPKGLLEAIGSLSEEMTAQGQQSVDGVATTSYTATVDMEEFAEQFEAGDADPSLNMLLGSVSMKEPELDRQLDRKVSVWIDDRGLIRRQAVSIDFQGQGSTATMEFYDFGASPRIPLPARAQVFDGTPAFIDQFRDSAEEQEEEDEE